MKPKASIWDFPLAELRLKSRSWGFKEYVADQIFAWLYVKGQDCVEKWSNISKAHREAMPRLLCLDLPEVDAIRDDGESARKLLIRLNDGQRIESVLLKEKGYFTFCLSTQVGCPLHCAFCATGQLGFKRNLTTGEIITQFILLRRQLSDFKGKINVVFMGMGEPLLNYVNLKKALEILLEKKGMNISPRRVTVSTAGILSSLQQLSEDFPHIKIAFSLNAAAEDLRSQLMPVNCQEPLCRILDYFRQCKKRERITFEYILIAGLNSDLPEAEKLVKLLRGIPCKINLIPCNENPHSPFRPPAQRVIEEFQEYLCARGFTVSLRWSKGKNIQSACGQLTAGQ